MQTFLHILSLTLLTFVFSACSAKTAAYNWERTKGAAYNAVVDPMTWAPLATGLALDATGYDDDITDHIIDKEEDLFTEEDADNLRTLTSAITYTTAIIVPDDNLTLKTKRVLVEALAFTAGRSAVDIMNDEIDREYPRPIPGEEDAIGSRHAVTPFLGAALTRRNLAQNDSIPDWGKYSINTVSYMAATGSAYQRIEEGLHSVSDQLYSVMVGNFLALFIHDAFMADDMSLNIDVSKEETKVMVGMSF